MNVGVMIFLIILIFLVCMIFGVLYAVFRKVFYCPPNKRKDIYELPDGEQYQEQREYMLSLIRDVAAQPYEWVSITSRDGLKLMGKYYHNADHAPVEIMFHGYHGAAEREFCGQFRICRELGHNALLVDQRAHGASQGTVTTFGIKERYDCLDWITYVMERFGANTKIMLCGLSMGAATVMMASELDLPENVIGIAADCGYDSPKNIICKVVEGMGWPPAKVYPFIRIAAMLFGHFNLDESSAIEALKHTKVPVLMIHGEDDRFVPCQMSRNCYQVCASERKYILTVPKAGHGISYILDKDSYVHAVKDFSAVCLEEMKKNEQKQYLH